MIHLNGNILCAIDCETTGLDIELHEVIQVCFLPLDWRLNPHPTITPFYLEMKPDCPENIDPKAMAVNKVSREHLMINCLPSQRVADLFLKWWDELRLPPNKGIAPLGKNWAFDSKFLKKWLGDKTFEMCINERLARDVQMVTHFVNDLADQKLRPVPFPKISLTSVATRLGINTDGAHDAMSDCIMTAQVYRRLMNFTV